jgi:hypothetical protein
MVVVPSITTESVKIVGTPQITHFKAVFRRHTNFLIEQKVHSSSGNELVSSNQQTYTITSGGHLLYKCWIEAELSPAAGGGVTESEYINWTNNTGHALIEEVQLYVSSNLIDKHSGLWLDVYNELNDIGGREHQGLNKHTCKNSYLKSNTHRLKPINLVIPLKFWFNTNPGLALPLVSLYNSKIEFKVKYRNLAHLINMSNKYAPDAGNTLTPPVIKFYTEIIHLDTPEATRFKQNRHEYLIETIQEQPPTPLINKVKLQFAHPVKELIWIIRHADRYVTPSPPATNATIDATLNRSYNSKGNTATLLFNTVGNQNIAHAGEHVAQTNDYFEYSCGTLGPNGAVPNFVATGHGGSNLYGYNTDGCDWFDTATVEIKGEKFSDPPLNASYLRTTHPYEHGHNVPNKHVYSYSFALNPNEYTPSGLYNLSDAENQSLNFINPIEATGSNSQISVFAVAYNIFRVFAGKGTLVFSQ